MNLPGSLVAQGSHQALHSIAAHNRVVYDYQTRPGNFGFDQVEFQVYFKLAQALIRFDKGAITIAVLNDCVAIRYTRGRGITQGRGDRRVGYWHNQVGCNGMFLRQLATQGFAHVVNIAAVELTGRVGEVNILENAQRFARHAYQHL